MISICLLTKCENVYLKEWIQHHLSIGIDHFYIYDNNDDLSAKDEILKYFDEQYFTFIPWLTYCKHMQVEAYNDCLEKFGVYNDWIAFIDTDEFIRCDNIYSSMSKYEQYDYIRMPWIMFNANGHFHYSNKPVRDRFTQIFDGKLDPCSYKSIVQPSKIGNMVVHEPSGNCKYIDVDDIKLDHYYTRSLEEWVDKINRGSCSPLSKKRYDEFFIYNPDMIEYKDMYSVIVRAYNDCVKTFDIRIMAHPSRRDNVLKVLKQLGADESIVIYDDRENGGDALYTARKAWLSTFDSNVTHRLVLQDDVLLCDNFLEIVKDIINTLSDNVISLFSTIPVDLVKRKKCCYKKYDNLSGVAIIMPVIYIKDCWKWIDENRNDCLCDDIMISKYCNKHGIKTYTTIPSIAQHLGDTDYKSLLPTEYYCARISTTYVQNPTDDFTVFVPENFEMNKFMLHVRNLRVQKILHRKE